VGAIIFTVVAMQCTSKQFHIRIIEEVQITFYYCHLTPNGWLFTAKHQFCQSSQQSKKPSWPKNFSRTILTRHFLYPETSPGHFPRMQLSVTAHGPRVLFHACRTRLMTPLVLHKTYRPIGRAYPAYSRFGIRGV